MKFYAHLKFQSGLCYVITVIKCLGLSECRTLQVGQKCLQSELKTDYKHTVNILSKNQSLYL